METSELTDEEIYNKFMEMDLIGKCFTDRESSKHHLDPRMSFKVDKIIENTYEINAFEMGTRYRTIEEFIEDIEQWSDKHRYVYGAHYPSGNFDDWRCGLSRLIDKVESGEYVEVTEDQWALMTIK